MYATTSFWFFLVARQISYQDRGFCEIRIPLNQKQVLLFGGSASQSPGKVYVSLTRFELLHLWSFTLFLYLMEYTSRYIFR